jgi:hypothetical protein
MGNVKDCYFKYAHNGDQFVGRCLCLLPILNVDLAVSPPFFTDSADWTWVDDMVKAQFNHLNSIGDYGLLLRMCLATMTYHRKWISDFLHFNHVVRSDSVLYNNVADMERIESEAWVIIAYPWSHPNLVFSGIPPYCSLLQHIAEVKSDQKKFFTSFIDQVKQALQEYGVNAGTLSEERVQAIMNQFLQDINVQISRFGGVGTNATPVVTERVETGGDYQWHMYRGSFHRVCPKLGGFQDAVCNHCGVSGGLGISSGKYLL